MPATDTKPNASASARDSTYLRLWHALATLRSLVCVALVLFATVVAWLLDQRTGIFLRPSYDLANLRFTGAEVVPDDIVLILLDDATRNALDQPAMQRFDRSLHTELLNKLAPLGPKLIYFDIVFDQPSDDPAIDTALVAAIQANRNVVLSAGTLELVQRETVDSGATRRMELFPPIPELRRAAAGWGLASLRHDEDFGIRQLYTGTSPDSNDIPTATWKAAQLLAPDKLADAGPRIAHRWLNYVCNPAHLAQVSLVTVIDPQSVFSQTSNIFKDKIIFIGSKSALDYSGAERDTFRTPFYYSGEPYADGVAIHAITLHNLLHHEWWRRLEPKWELLLLLGVGAVLGLAFSSLSPRNGLLALFVAVPGTLFTVHTLCQHQHEFMSWLIIILVQIPVAVGAGVGSQYYQERRRRQRLKRSFATYLSPVMVHRMVESGEEPSLGGEQVEITAFFSDVVGFSGFSEVLDSAQLVTLMNEYLGAMTTLLLEEQGTLDKYIGDAIVGFFNAPIRVPDHALRACTSALRMQQRLSLLRAEWAASAKWPPLVVDMHMRIGLNTGLATVGNMGSDQRFNYTMMGDTVNLAARCESAAKQYGVYTMVTEETLRAALGASGPVPDTAGQPLAYTRLHAAPFAFRYLDRIVVKGRSQPCTVYELLDFSTAITPAQREHLALYETGVSAFLNRRFSEAADAFSHYLATREKPPASTTKAMAKPTDAAALLLDRSRTYTAEPPAPEWVGVQYLKDK
ncbi:MAG: adenylate/guanylate cyclase domain-containing protein [Verrucomicrobiota bacterium]|nr:adenylate/guanylate cyclase domain-containing protein [Verrucomicrobiota bacterium]